MYLGPLSSSQLTDPAPGSDLAATAICGTRAHPGFGRTHADCEREVRRLERAGGAGQWLYAVKQDHRAALDPLRYRPDLDAILDAIRWLEDPWHGPSRPRRLSCLWACPHRAGEPPERGCPCGQPHCPGCRHGAWLDRARRRFLAAQGKPARLPLRWRTRAVLAATSAVNRLAARLIVADHPEAARRLWQVTGLWH